MSTSKLYVHANESYHIIFQYVWFLLNKKLFVRWCLLINNPNLAHLSCFYFKNFNLQFKHLPVWVWLWFGWINIFLSLCMGVFLVPPFPSFFLCVLGFWGTKTMYYGSLLLDQYLLISTFDLMLTQSFVMVYGLWTLDTRSDLNGSPGPTWMEICFWYSAEVLSFKGGLLYSVK